MLRKCWDGERKSDVYVMSRKAIVIHLKRIYMKNYQKAMGGKNEKNN